MEWQPIETAPSHKLVLVWTPEMKGWAALAWNGMKGSDGSWGIATPFVELDGRRVFASELGVSPTHWMPLPEPPK